MSMKGKAKTNPFACLGTPPDERPKDMINTDNYSSNVGDDEHKSIPSTPATPRNSLILPSLASASRSLLSSASGTPTNMESMDRSFINRDYQFVFRSRPIESCKYEPYKVILFIASAQGYGDKNSNDNYDPRLSANGVSQCKIVSSALRKAKQTDPNIMYCSTMYRALSTMQLVCADWYDDVKSIGIDELRPKIGKFKSNKRSNINLLKQDFRPVSFHHVKSDKDIFWKAENLETEDNFSLRIHKFITKFLVPQSELLKTQYGTLKPSKLDNIGWNPSASTSAISSPASTSSIHVNKRIVVISHRDVLAYLMKNIVIDISPALCKDWKHCDLRKVFVYTKQQLGMNDIPCYTLGNSTYYTPRFSRKKAKNNNDIHRSKTPNSSKTRRGHKKSNSMINFDDSNNHNRKNNGIATTSSGDILMTNKLFALSTMQYTLTSMSAAIINNKYNKSMPIIPLQSSVSADNVSKNKTNDNNCNDEESSLERIESTDDDDIPTSNPVQNYSQSQDSTQLTSKKKKARNLMVTNSDRHIMHNQSNKNNDKRNEKSKQHIIIVTPPSKSSLTGNLKTKI